MSEYPSSLHMTVASDLVKLESHIYPSTILTDLEGSKSFSNTFLSKRYHFISFFIDFIAYFTKITACYTLKIMKILLKIADDFALPHQFTLNLFGICYRSKPTESSIDKKW